VNTNNPQPITSFEGHTSNVTAIGFERDGRWMYSGSEDGTVKIWDLRASGFQREYESRGAVNSVVLHPNQVRGAGRGALRGPSVCFRSALGGLWGCARARSGVMRTILPPQS
jgi:WD40 repeat protein